MVLPKIISPYQITFVPQRDIHRSILIAHETLATFSEQRKALPYPCQNQSAWPP